MVASKSAATSAPTAASVRLMAVDPRQKARVARPWVHTTAATIGGYVWREYRRGLFEAATTRDRPMVALAGYVRDGTWATSIVPRPSAVAAQSAPGMRPPS